MKKLFIVIGVIVLAIVIVIAIDLIGFRGFRAKRTAPLPPTVATASLAPLPSPTPKEQRFVITADQYATLVSTVMKRGVKVAKRGDVQLTSWSSDGNRHAMVAIYHEDSQVKGRPPVVTQLSTWVNNKQAKPGHEFFSYIIQPNGGVYMMDYARGRIGEARKGIDEMLASAKLLKK